MKCIKLLLFLFFLVLNLNHSNAQYPPYAEQVSGVTTSLNSVCMAYNYYPGQVWACGAGGVILKTTNQGTNWINVSSGQIPSNINLQTISCKLVDTVIAAGTSTGTSYVYRTVNGGTNWSLVFTLPVNINAIGMKNGRNSLLVGNPIGGRWSLWKTTNGGLNWDSSGLYLPQAGSETGWRNSLYLANDSIWFGTNNSRIYKTTNFGISWTIISTGSELNSSILNFSNRGFLTYYSPVFGGSNLFYSTNNGINWQQASCPGSGNFNGFCSGQLGVYAPFVYGPGYATRGDSNIYVGNFGPNLTTDYSAPSGTYNHMAADYLGILYSWAVRSNGGITKVTIFRGGAVHSISSRIPETFRLEQNFPNPFNPSTSIRFNLPNTEFVTIKIFDGLGREVSTIVNEQLHAGEYETSYDASSLASGIYFYSLITADFVQTKKMILVK